MSRFDPDTLPLGEERERLAREYDRIESELESVEEDSDEWRRLNSELSRIDGYGRTVDWLIDGDEPDDPHGDFEGYGPEATITVRGLDAGEYAIPDSKTAQASLTTGEAASGQGKIAMAAAGLVDAPFYDGSPDDFDAKFKALSGTKGSAGQPKQVREYVQHLVNERTVVGRKNWRESGGPSGDETPT